jgi:hypothetical protein
MSRSASVFASSQGIVAASRLCMALLRNSTVRTKHNMQSGIVPPRGIASSPLHPVEARADAGSRREQSTRYSARTSFSVHRRIGTGRAVSGTGLQGGRTTTSSYCRSHQRMRAWANRRGPTTFVPHWVWISRRHRAIVRFPVLSILFLVMPPCIWGTYRLEHLHGISLPPIIVEQVCAD